MQACASCGVHGQLEAFIKFLLAYKDRSASSWKGCLCVCRVLSKSLRSDILQKTAHVLPSLISEFTFFHSFLSFWLVILEEKKTYRCLITCNCMFCSHNCWENQTTINMLKAKFCRMLNIHKRNDERKDSFPASIAVSSRALA